MSVFEKLFLNPVEFTPDLPEIDLSAAGISIGAAGPNFGESSVTVERVKQAIGEGVTSAHWPSVECEVPLIVSSDPAVSQAAAFKPVESFVAEVQRRNRGWLRREFADAAGFSGAVGCLVDAAGISTPKGKGRVDEITLKLSRHPFWFATVEVESAEFKGVNVRDLEFELAEMLGTVPGLIRIVVKNEGTEDWRGCIVPLECDDYSPDATAKPKYEARELTLRGGSTSTEVSGAKVVKCPPLTRGWVTALSSLVTGKGHMTHLGPRRMLFRVNDVSSVLDDAQWKLEWRALGSAAWIQTQEGSTPKIVSSPVIGNYQLLDLGECRIPTALTGEQRWEWRLQVRSESGSGKQPLIRDAYPSSGEQWLRVADSSENPIDGQPAATGGTVANETGVGSVAWKAHSGSGTMSFAKESEYPTIASMSAATNYLKVTNFGFGSLIPAGATIRGVIARAVPFSASGSIEEKRARIVIEGAIKEAEDKATPGGGSNYYWNSPTVRSWGGIFDLWGLGTITRAQVIASNFGFALALGGPLFEVGETRTISFQRIEMIVAYSEGGNENRICFASRSVEFSDAGVRRQHATDEVWGDLVEEGFTFYAPAPGQAAQPMRGLLIPSVGDFSGRADSASLKLSGKANYRPAYLFAREAI